MTQSFLAHLFASKEVGGKKTKTSRCFSSSYPLIYLIMCRKWTHITDVLEESGSRYCLGCKSQKKTQSLQVASLVWIIACW